MAPFDNHIHLARLPHPMDIARELHARGYRYRAIACEPWEWRAIDEIWASAKEAGRLDGCGRAYGIHPMIVAELSNPSLDGSSAIDTGNSKASGTEDLWQELRRRLESDPEAQVGEAGIDKRFSGYGPGGIQEVFFRRQAELALELGRDLQIHCVGDYGRIVKILREVGFGADADTGGDAGIKSNPGLKCNPGVKCSAGIKCARAVFHRFGGDAGIVKAGLSLGALFSIHPDSLRKKATREALAQIPPEYLLFETDADESFVVSRKLENGAIQDYTPPEIADALVARIEDVEREVNRGRTGI